MTCPCYTPDMSKILAGLPPAAQITGQVTNQLRQLQTSLSLQILLVGHEAPSEIYVKRKQQMAEKVGIAATVTKIPESSTTEEAIALIEMWNNQPQVTAILVQLPLPDHIDTLAVLASIKPNKDADGLHPYNQGLLLSNRPSIVPATAKGVMAMLAFYNISLEGKGALVIGRSQLVGQPTALLLSQAGATVTVAHRQTTDLPSLLRQSDLIVCSAGQPGLIGPEEVKPQAVIIDVGISRLGGKLLGDAGLVYEADKVEAISPVPGGVGPLTVACLLDNVLVCYRLQQDDPV